MGQPRGSLGFCHIPSVTSLFLIQSNDFPSAPFFYKHPLKFFEGKQLKYLKNMILKVIFEWCCLSRLSLLDRYSRVTGGDESLGGEASQAGPDLWSSGQTCLHRLESLQEGAAMPSGQEGNESRHKTQDPETLPGSCTHSFYN